MHAKQNGLEIVEVIPKEDLAMACMLDVVLGDKREAVQEIGTQELSGETLKASSSNRCVLC